MEYLSWKRERIFFYELLPDLLVFVCVLERYQFPLAALDSLCHLIVALFGSSVLFVQSSFAFYLVTSTHLRFQFRKLKN